MLTWLATILCLKEMCRVAAKLEHLKNICSMAGHLVFGNNINDEDIGFPNSFHIHIVA